MMEVDKMPINRPTKGFVVVAMRVSAKPLPNILSEVPINSRLKRKRYSDRINNKIWKNVL